MNLRFYKVTYIVTHINYMDWLYTLSRLFNSQLHDSSAVADMIVQQSLARLFNSHWQDYSTVTGTILQQSLAGFFISYWHDSSTVTDRSFVSMLAEFFNSEDHCWKIVPCKRNTAHDPGWQYVGLPKLLMDFSSQYSRRET